MHTSVELERRGIPTTVVITSAFRNALEVQYRGKGMPGHACIELPHPIYYLSREELSKITREHMDEMVRQLTQAG
ncbi:MAG: hypothetical protein A3G24_27695 [Betaproteobacteria bacterium RIFCSPLOWO2_12_FULL_62_13]|nr:MAG: hypothetical protein A3G24_27695 [Betaproteobacteria bacterium RIFCSPLOWO2_12_FULL_62_13]